ncbi:MAG: RNA polymerase sigma factor [Gammaproteobacteria bacterium]|nr:RNA polymerase sigma factor [Gammaproteobacteria bacterium]
MTSMRARGGQHIGSREVPDREQRVASEEPDCDRPDSADEASNVNADPDLLDERARRLGSLLERSAAGDREAFKQLYDQTSRLLFSITLRILGDRSAAEDALQDAYVQVWTSAASQRPNASVLGWMCTIARHKAIDRRRQQSAQGKMLLADTHALLDERRADSVASALGSDGRSTEDTLLENLLSAEVQRCLATLEPEPRQALLLAYYRGLSHEEIARLLEHPVGTVKSWIRRALLRLRASVEPP